MRVNKEATKEKKDHSIKVLRAHAFDNGNVAVDIEVNDVTIYGAVIIEGEKGDFISFPNHKVGDAYYSYARFPYSDKDLETIEAQAKALLES